VSPRGVDKLLLVANFVLPQNYQQQEEEEQEEEGTCGDGAGGRGEVHNAAGWEKIGIPGARSDAAGSSAPHFAGAAWNRLVSSRRHAW